METSKPVNNFPKIGQLSIISKFSYGLGDLASNLCWSMVTTYLLFFYTDVFQLQVAAVGTLFFIARFWDAIVDPIVGNIADNTRTRWGRFRPYLLFGPLALAVFTVLCFSVPNFSNSGKLIYAYITYILLGMCYSLVNVPYGAMAATLTQDTDERSKLAAFRTFFAVIGSLIIALATLPIVNKIQSALHTGNGFFYAACIYSILMVPLFWVVFRNTKEVVEVPKQRSLSFADICKVIFQNKPLLMVLVTSLLASISLFIKQSMTIYYTTYVVKDANLSSLLLGIMAICMLIGILIATPLSIRLGSKKITMMIGIGAAALACIGLYITGPTRIALIYVWTILAAIFSGLTFVMVWSMIADTIEFAEWKTGFRADGLIYSSASFVQKLATALAGWLAAMLLSVTHYAPNIEQTRQAMTGINLSMTILPGVLLLISLFSLIFYKLDRKSYNQILAEIQTRKADQ